MAKDSCGSLEECPWQLWTDHGFIVKCFKIPSTACEILISDLSQSWYEKLTSADVIRKNSMWNPNIEAKVDRIFDHIMNIIDRRTESKSLLEIVEQSKEMLTIKSESMLSSLSFSWEFNLTNPKTDMVTAQLTKPLLTMVSELFLRQQELLNIIANKDLQISDYKAEGITLPRKYKYEHRFDENEFNVEMEKNKDIRGFSMAISSFNPQFHKLYSFVMKRSISCNTPVGKNNTNDANALLEKTESFQKSPDLHFEQSEEEMELARREILERRLAEERAKMEIPKKKLKL